MKKILITGGPVHAHLDAVKIITNKFMGGLIAEFADRLVEYGNGEIEVHYVAATRLGAIIPNYCGNGIILYEHQGFKDYERIVLELAPSMDAVILGAAFVNLVPVKPWQGKFPSHNYKEGDIIPIDFMIAPRVINKVKSVAPKTHLFGFKLLSGVPHEELIRAAYEIVLASGATAVFANDEKNLKQVYAVTKERGVHPLQRNELADWIWEMVNDKYYYTAHTERLSHSIDEELQEFDVRKLTVMHKTKFITVENGMIFGTVAVRYKSGFVTTGRGKHELEDIVKVVSVDHSKHEVLVEGPKKASLNAPLLARLFENEAVDHIVHYHQQEPTLPTLQYAPPGTVRDSNRPNHVSFNIEGHGCMLLFDKKERQL